MVYNPTDSRLRWALPFPRTGGALLAEANDINGPGQRTTLDPTTTRSPTVAVAGGRLRCWTDGPLSAGSGFAVPA